MPFSFNVNTLKGTIDRFEYHGAFDIADAAALIFGLEHERGNFAYTPNAGRTVFRGTYADGFRAPTLTESVLPFGILP
ncbi:MAG: hypothetical protein IPI83_00735 [Sphingomonadales bacterium]|nr:hypothetical protein [Sphingomonadales bacterium]